MLQTRGDEVISRCKNVSNCITIETILISANNIGFKREIMDSEWYHSLLFGLWPRAYKTFFMLNSAEHEISMLNKSNLIKLLL